MQQAIDKTEALLAQGLAYFTHQDEATVCEPIAPGKWSRKQILGHLIDSAVNNLQRFTEIEYQPQPYIYREYNQNELVRVNDYQNADMLELLPLWILLNKQIVRVMRSASEERLNLQVRFTRADPGDSGTAKPISDLRFLMTDYPEHMEHHIRQIVN